MGSTTSKPTWQTDDQRIRLYRGDFLRVLPALGEEIADFVLLDLPYGSTNLAWDVRVELAAAWDAVHRAAAPTAIVAAFACQPFVTDLINANNRRFRYELIWRKTAPRGFLDANRRPLRDHENILIFAERFAGSIYRPQFGVGKPYRSNGGRRFPKSVWDAASEKRRGAGHTRKPPALVEKLVRTYSDANDTVLDPCFGSGTTVLAAVRCGRRVIAIEKDRARFREALKTIQAELAAPKDAAA